MLRIATNSTDDPPIAVHDPELAGYIQSLRRRIEIQNIQLENLSKLISTLQTEVEKLSLDLGSLLQGYAADQAARILRREGLEEFLIEVGGEVLAAGTWRVGLEDPFQPRMTMETVVLTDRALSVSGLYRARKAAAGKPVSHIISPLTGEPVVPTLELAAVFHSSCAQADGWSTALMSVGFEPAKLIAERENLDVILVAPDKQVWRRAKTK